MNMNIKIYYGSNNHVIDVTSICLSKLKYNNIITIPSSDENRSFYFTDPIFGKSKKIFIIIDENVNEYDYFYTIKINTIDNTITTINEIDIIDKITNIQSKLNIKYGTFYDELPEQKMVVRYLNGNEKVLEIGGNIGRNSLIISSILGNNNFVTLSDSY